MKSRFNLIFKIFAIVLSVISCLSVVACKKDDGGDNSPIDTGKYIVKDCASEYTILMPEKRDENLNVAVSELQLGIEKTTGYKMPMTTVYTEGKKYLSVGKTQLYLNNKAIVDGDGLEKTELRVLTINDNVIMIGGENEYTVYAVYDFMEKSFGFKWYAFDACYVSETDVIPLYNLDWTDKPVMSMRCLYQWDFWVDAEQQALRCRRMRVHEFKEFHFIPAGHNMIGTVIPKSVYAAEHPEWFSKPTGGLSYTEAGQLCVTNPELIKEFIRRTKQLITENWGDGSNKYFMIGMEDAWDACECDLCKAKLAINGSHTGNWIEFANTVSREINAWVKELDPEKTIYFPMFAYFFTEEAPVKEVDGKYVPYNENVVPDPEVLMLYAPLNNSFTYAFNDPRNSKTYTTLKKWHAVAKDNFMMYSYAFTADSMHPMNDLVTLGGSVAQAVENNYYGWIEESGTYFRFASMQPLKNYVRAKLFWGTEKSVDELAFEFIDFYYGPVAQEFKQYYISLKQWQTYQMEELDIFISILGYQYITVQNWPVNVIDGFAASIEDMLAKIEVYKNIDTNLYDTYFRRINTEKIWTTWSYCTLHGKYFNDLEFNQMLDFLTKYMFEYKVRASETMMATIESMRR